MMDEIEKAEIVARLKALTKRVVPEAAFVAKYGGTMIEAIPGEPKSQFCGVFSYKNHVSLELTHGIRLGSGPINFVHSARTVLRSHKEENRDNVVHFQDFTT